MAHQHSRVVDHSSSVSLIGPFFFSKLQLEENRANGPTRYADVVQPRAKKRHVRTSLLRCTEGLVMLCLNSDVDLGLGVRAHSADS